MSSTGVAGAGRAGVACGCADTGLSNRRCKPATSSSVATLNGELDGAAATGGDAADTTPVALECDASGWAMAVATGAAGAFRAISVVLTDFATAAGAVSGACACCCGDRTSVTIGRRAGVGSALSAGSGGSDDGPGCDRPAGLAAR